MYHLLLSVVTSISFFQIHGYDFDDPLEEHHCSFDEALDLELQNDLEFKLKYDVINAHWLYNRDHHEHRRLQESLLPNPITIPINFHLIIPSNTAQYGVEAGYERIISQMRVLNDAYFALNDDITDDELVVDLIGNFSIQFTLNKIIRVASDKSVFFGKDAKYSSMGGSDNIDPNHMLNVWVLPSGGWSGAGQATPPGTSNDVDGILLNLYGLGALNVFYKHDVVNEEWGDHSPNKLRGSSLVHEIGHWLNLQHIWGSTGCDYSDLVNDTAIAYEPNRGDCPSYDVISCGTNDMYMNYMDYSKCRNMFTKGQVARGLDVFTAGGARERLLDYYSNPTHIYYVDYFYFIHFVRDNDNNNEPECTIGHKLIDLNINRLIINSDFEIYLCVSFSNNPYMDIITDITINYNFANMLVSCPSDEYQQINTNFNYDSGLDYDIMLCYKKESQCSSISNSSDGITDITVFELQPWNPYNPIHNGYNLVKKGNYVYPLHYNSNVNMSALHLFMGYKKEEIISDETLCFEEINSGEIKTYQLSLLSTEDTKIYQTIFKQHSYTFIERGGEYQSSSVDQIHFTIFDNDLNVDILFLNEDMSEIKSCTNCTELMIEDMDVGRYFISIHLNSDSGAFKISMEHGTLSCGEITSEQTAGSKTSRLGSYEEHYYRVDVETDYKEIYFESCGSEAAVVYLALFDVEMNLIEDCYDCNNHGAECGYASDLTANNLTKGIYYLRVQTSVVDETTGTFVSFGGIYSVQMMCSGYNYFEECGYKYIDNDEPKTWIEGDNFCLTEFGTHLATISDVSDLNCLRGISLKSSPWIGLNNNEFEDQWQYIDGTDCDTLCDIDDNNHPELCVCTNVWYKHRAITGDDGSDCARIFETKTRNNRLKIINDYQCDTDTLTAVLCNAESNNISSVYSIIHYISPTNAIYVALLFFIITNICICYWCIPIKTKSDSSEQHKSVKKYQKVKVIDIEDE